MIPRMKMMIVPPETVSGVDFAKIFRRSIFVAYFQTEYFPYFQECFP